MVNQKKRTVIIATVIAVLAIIGLLLFFYLSRQPSNDSQAPEHQERPLQNDTPEVNKKKAVELQQQADNHFNAGDYGQAESDLRQAKDLYNKADDPASSATVDQQLKELKNHNQTRENTESRRVLLQTGG